MAGLLRVLIFTWVIFTYGVCLSLSICGWSCVKLLNIFGVIELKPLGLIAVGDSAFFLHLLDLVEDSGSQLTEGIVSFVTDLNTESSGANCVVGLECVLNIIRFLTMGSCFSCESRSPVPTFPMVAKKKKVSTMTSFEYSRENRLHRNHNRMFLNGSSEIASLFTQQGKKGVNQDAMIVWEKFGSRTDTIFCGVFDGHGPYGHMVAKCVRDSLPLKLSAHWEVDVQDDEILRETGSKSEIFNTLKETFLDAFKVMDKELRMNTNFDCLCSGTTAVTLVKQGQDLIIGNIGDSRAVLGMRDANNAFVPVQLTVDLKPDLPAEEERIRKCRGRIFALRDEPKVARVWLPHNDAPGLAMARAFGDFCLKEFGLISVPEISYRRIIDEDEFVVLATDGVWDVLSNEEVVTIVGTCPTRSYAARAVVAAAVRAWRYMYPTSNVDDCAVVCLFLDSDESTSSSANSTAPEEDESTNYHDPYELNRSGTIRTGSGAIEEK
ncbi:hypothetical protein SASPL_136977 [Salvia splendens]|uniref:PPM-type phosphatase domain-containing protein n=2 Tax=Salvia splendens TaxID=180675 RepID=A0A8X8X2A0_SALSN|nr:hypothetical protein SASPL_136977 [Salvia splendens]